MVVDRVVQAVDSIRVHRLLVFRRGLAKDRGGVGLFSWPCYRFVTSFLNALSERRYVFETGRHTYVTLHRVVGEQWAFRRFVRVWFPFGVVADATVHRVVHEFS